MALTCVVWSWAKTLHHLLSPQTHSVPLVLQHLPPTQTQRLCLLLTTQTTHVSSWATRRGGFMCGAESLWEEFLYFSSNNKLSILSLHPADFEGKICPWPTASEPVWDSRGTVRSCTWSQELRRLAGLLHIPVQKLSPYLFWTLWLALQEMEARLSRDDRQGAWSLSQNNSRWILKRIREKYKISDKIEKLFSEFPSLLQAKLFFLLAFLLIFQNF